MTRGVSVGWVLGLIIPLLVGLGPAAPVLADDPERWQPTVGLSWEIQLNNLPKSEEIKQNVAVYDIDLFEAADQPGRLAEIRGADRRIICYFSAGSYEQWRPDRADFPGTAIGKKLDGWKGERWLNVKNLTVRNIMRERLDLAQEIGCDAVDPDNVDGYLHDTGFNLKREDLVDYNQFLATEAHARGLAIGLKNGLEIVGALLDSHDFAVNEQCFQYRECGRLQPFINAGKPVFNIEYGNFKQEAKQVCGSARNREFSTLIKKLNLDARRKACPLP